MKRIDRFQLNALLFLLGTSSVLWVFLYSLGPKIPIPHSDCWDYIQLGRSIAEGNGFESLFTYPILLSIDPEPPFLTFWRLPVYPLLCSFPFLVFENPPISVFIGMGGFFYVLSCGLFFLWLNGFFSVRSSLFGSFLWIANPHLLDSSLQGLSEPFFICLLLGVFLILSRVGTFHPLLLGGLVGLCWMTRSNTLLFIPGLLLFLSVDAPSKVIFLKRAGWIAVAVAAVCLPWWVRNLWAVGDPFFNMSGFLPLMMSGEYPGWTLFRTDFESLGEIPSVPVGEIIRGGLIHLWDFAILQRLLSCNPILILLALFGGWSGWKHRRRDPRFFLWVIFVAVTDAITMIFLCFVEPVIRLYLPVIPLVYLLALRGMEELGMRVSGKIATRVILIVVFVSVFAYLVRFAASLEKEPWPVLAGDSIANIQAMASSESLFLSDTPDYLATVLDRDTVFLPTLGTIDHSLERWDCPVFVHLSPMSSSFLQGEGEGVEDWELWLKNQRIKQDTLKNSIGSGHVIVKVR